jgi:hypothetical protein
VSNTELPIIFCVSFFLLLSLLFSYFSIPHVFQHKGSAPRTKEKNKRHIDGRKWSLVWMDVRHGDRRKE